MESATDVPPRPQPAARYALTAAALAACGLMLWPFLPGVAAGLATAAVCLPLHRRLVRWTGGRHALAAGLTTAVAVLGVVVPLALVSAQLTAEARKGVEAVREKAADGGLRETASRIPYVGDWLDRVNTGEVDIEAEARAAVARLGRTSLGLAYGAAAVAVQLLIGGFVLFFTLKDHPHLLAAVKRLVPLPDRQAGHVVTRMDDAVQATVYGTVLTGVLQGVTGGLLFWWLGLPAPVLWGVVMTVLSVLPVLGAFLVWLPAAAWLASTRPVVAGGRADRLGGANGRAGVQHHLCCDGRRPDEAAPDAGPAGVRRRAGRVRGGRHGHRPGHAGAGGRVAGRAGGGYVAAGEGERRA